jgi:hypothetical protein
MHALLGRLCSARHRTLSPVPTLICVASAVGILGLALIVTGLIRLRARPRANKARGFAQIAVGAALLVLIATAIPSVLRIPFYDALSVCRSNLRFIGCALRDYANDYAEYPPSLRMLVDQGLVNDWAVACPFSRGTADFAYVTGIAPSNPREWLIAFDLADSHEDRSRNVLFRGGEVRCLTADQFQNAFAHFAAEFQATKGHPPTVLGSGAIEQNPETQNSAPPN